MRIDNVMVIANGGKYARETLTCFRRFGLIVENTRSKPRRVEIDIRGGIVSSDETEERAELGSVGMLDKVCPFEEQLSLL